MEPVPQTSPSARSVGYDGKEDILAGSLGIEAGVFSQVFLALSRDFGLYRESSVPEKGMVGAEVAEEAEGVKPGGRARGV